jgi:hypothetical protein
MKEKLTEKQLKEWFEKWGKEVGDLPYDIGRRPKERRSPVDVKAPVVEVPKKKKKA